MVLYFWEWQQSCQCVDALLSGALVLGTTLCDEKLLRSVLFRLAYLVKPDQAGLFHLMCAIVGTESWEKSWA